MKYSFKNDYSEGAHPSVLDAFAKTNEIQQEGYGLDEYCNHAGSLIKSVIRNHDADVHFVTGGTQANAIVISSVLKPYESVISADSGHIAVHEAGAIENTGHKINCVPSSDGKLTPEGISAVLEAHVNEHMVKPGMVFISNATEIGTIYTKAELKAISTLCRDKDLILYLDGARLGCALTASDSDLTIADVAALTDVFYIGGTKNGALMGEAVIITDTLIKPYFRYHIKQHGALLAKSRLLGLQFSQLFNGDLYFDLARHANMMAKDLSEGIRALGFSFLSEPVTNQIFPVLPNPVIKKLETKYGFYVWQAVDNTHSAIRLVTSWQTPETAVLCFLSDLNKVM
jgi:threonine aldolase